MHIISSSELKISQHPSSLQGTEQLVIVLELRSSMHPKILLYETSNSSSNNLASCSVSNRRCSFKKVNPSLPVRISGFSMVLQMVLGSDGGITRAVIPLLEATTPAATAAATTTLMETVTVVVVVVAGSIPKGPMGATATTPLALTPAAQDDAAF